MSSQSSTAHGGGARVVWIFPGQGSQAVGMGSSLFDTSTAARDVLVLANVAWGGDLGAILRDGPADILARTDVTQPGIVAVSLAAVAALREAWAEGDGGDLPRPHFVAGHSVGEYAAVVASGATDVATGIGLVCERARLMQWAAGMNPGGMVAVLGLGRDVVEEACRAAREAIPDSYVTVANHNSHAPAQVVIAGDQAGLDQASAMCRDRGARRCVPLPVGGAFHSPAMAPAREGLARAIAQAPIGIPLVPVVSNISAGRLGSAREIRVELAEQVTSQVRWAETMDAFATAGCSRFIEFGSGAVLSGLIQRAIPGADVIQVGDAEGVARAVAWLRE